MLDRFSLQLQIGQCISANVFGLMGCHLRVPQPLRTTVQPLGAGKQLLSLLQLIVRVGIVRVAVAKQGFPVVGEGFELAFCGIDVGFKVAEPLVYFRPCGGGDVGSFDTHLVQLNGSLGQQDTICTLMVTGS